MEHFDVGVVGTGYVGLATGASLAYVGHRVTCLDNNEERVASLREGKVPFYEPGLQELIAKSAGRLRFASSERLTEVIRGSDVLIVAVGTPHGGDGSADLSNVADVARAIGHALGGSTPRELPLVVVNKSTVPVGGAYYVSTLVDEGIDEVGGKGAKFRVASNPEFLREGSAVHDSLFPDRVVVGTDSREALDVLRTLYIPIVEQSFPTEWDPRPKVAVPFVTTDLASAEMIKYAANAFLATKISFINEVALRATAREYEYETTLRDAAATVNERQRRRVIHKLQRDLHSLKGRCVALLGLSFKPNTDDLRGAPSLTIARALNSLGAKVVGYDPVAGKPAAKLTPAIQAVFH